MIGPEPQGTTLEQKEQALRYLTSAVEDKDLRAATAQAADNAPDALRWLETEYLQGVEKMPANGRLLKTMSLPPNENVTTSKSRFTKLARQIVPPPGKSVLSSRYIEATTRQTGSTYDDCVWSASAIGGHGDFPVFSTLLTRLCTQQKVARVTTQREASAGPTELNTLMTLS